MTVRAHPAFTHTGSREIPSLKLEVQRYRHLKTGAEHIHLSAANPENVFLVALRTVPRDSTGVAHILEHTALCGSEKYPVRDPFFMMIRRSLNTFMNAFTSSDWTAYPFASQNRKDFDNLLDVYLDAVFFARLDELDFAQEGHRLEFAEPDNPNSPLVHKGVVYNEMKGAMSSINSILWHTLTRYLYPTSTYHHNSGGDPACIVDLSYRQLLDFYRTHYHPSNAIFMTYGDIPAHEHQRKFEDQVLNRFERLDEVIAVAPEKRYLAPLRVQEAYGIDEPDTKARTHVVLGWLLGRTTDLMANMEAHLLNSVLLDNSASPLLHALETSDLGTAPSPLCGLDDSHLELLFACGLEGSEPEHGAAVEALVLDTLRAVAEQGVPADQVEAALHQLELKQREISGDGYPYGLQLILTALASATHRGDPAALLDLDPVLAELRERIRDPDYIKRLTRTLLLDNTHRVRLDLYPDADIPARREAAERRQLDEIRAALGEAQCRELVARAQALAQRQARVDDDEILPRVELADVPPRMAYVEAAARIETPLRLTGYGAGTNGLVYQQLVLDLPQLSEEQTDLLPLYASCLPDLGVGEHDYLATQRWQAAVSGGVNAYVSVRGLPDDAQALRGHLVISTKGLAVNQRELSRLLDTTLNQVRFDELDRLRDLIAQLRARMEHSVPGNGHSLAMAAAAARFNNGALLQHRWSGLEGIRQLKRLDASLADAGELRALAVRLREIHALVLAAPRQCLLVAEPERLADFQAQFLAAVSPPPAGGTFSGFARPPLCAPSNELWITGTQVNFCARAYPTVPMDHPDAAPLSVLGGFLRNGYLHTAIRERGGAYGGGASQDNGIAAFRFFSYRDPRLTETLADFDRALDWLASGSHAPRRVEEAILGVIAGLDKPGSPAGEAKQTFHAELHGRDRARRERFRNRVLQVGLDDLRRVAAGYLIPERASTAVITAPDRTAQLAGLDLQTIAL
jgi:presequence protease